MDSDHCSRCGACCRWSGILDVHIGEVEAIARFCGISVEIAQDVFVDSAEVTGAMTVRSADGGECIFLDGNTCAVYPVRPVACRKFPRAERITPSLLDKCAVARWMQLTNRAQARGGVR